MELTEAPVMDKVKHGYKKTEVGVIPVDWEIASLGELGSFKNGINKAKEDFGHGSPFVNLMDIFGIPTIESVGHLSLINSTHGERQLYNLSSGDVLFVRSSVKPEGVGLTTLVLKDLPGAVFSGFLLRYRTSARLTKEYKQHCFTPEGFRSRLIASSTVSANTNINQSALKALLLAFPKEPSEQYAIATALSDVDALLVSLDALIAKKKAIKQGTMQRLLTGKQRLKGFEGEWEVKRLGDMLTLRHGKPQHAIVKADGKYPILGTGGIMAWTDEYLCNKPSVMIGRKGTIDLPRYMDTPFWTVDTLFYSEIFDDTDAKFLYYRFWLIDWYRYNESSGVPSMIASTVESIELEVPKTREEQTAIATVLSDMDEEISTMEARRAKTVLLKQGMMQELLTGRTRLIQQK